jgi:hypothetical protein
VQEWASLETVGFPGYELSNDGLVRNARTERVLKTSANQEGIIRVGLMKREEGRQVTVSLVRLVARMFVAGRSATFDTPIQLNGDRNDCSHGNIMWRPRWFAVKFFNQFEDSEEPMFRTKIYDVETSREYRDSREAASANGLLEEDIMKSVVNGSPCFPTWQIFARVSH